MIDIIPVPAFEDNYIWLLVHQRNVVAIDPGDATAVLAVLKKIIGRSKPYLLHTII